ncbi:MAG: hypothetical protein SXU28_15310 [Pseudomonadota bacterium]|nr:hypothetical protein [Pseudomonadota bacterium]
MKVPPEIAALRAEGGSQQPLAASHEKAMRDALARWHNRPEIAALLSEVQGFGSGAPIEECGHLHSLTRQHDLASDFVRSFNADMLSQLRHTPLGEVPLRFKSSRGFSTLQIVQAGRATLSLVAYEPSNGVALPSSAVFADRASREMIIAGEASAISHRRRDDDILTEPLALTAGCRISCKPMAEARQIVSVKRSLLMVQLTREPQSPKPTQEISLETGQILKQASGDKSASQAAMALSVLGTLSDNRAVRIFVTTACNLREDGNVRWEAARQALASDSVAGIRLLDRLAADECDPLAGAARDLRDRLLDGHPSLRIALREAA